MTIRIELGTPADYMSTMRYAIIDTRSSLLTMRYAIIDT